MEENDVILYADSGCEIDVCKKNDIISLLNKDFEIICNTAGSEKEWTKRDLLIYLDMDKENIINEQQFEATSVCIKKCEKTLQFVKEWYEIACNYNLIDDSPSKNPNYREFKENRYDQSIFSLLMKKYYNYDKNILIGQFVELSRNRTGISKLKNFDWEQYIENYEDLRKAGINTQQKALQHYNRYGKRENRTFYKEIK
jgi:hypothetical protein